LDWIELQDELDGGYTSNSSERRILG